MSEDPKEWMLVRSNGETLEMRKVTEVVAAFRSPRENRNPLPIRDEIISIEDAKDLYSELATTPGITRTK